MTRRGRALLRVGSLAGAALVWIVVDSRSEPWELGRDVALLRGTGWLACAALLLSLVMSPLGRLHGWWILHRGQGSSQRTVVGSWAAYRRAFGVVAGCGAALHAAVALSTYLWTSWRALLEVPYLRSGTVALWLLLALLVTSFRGPVVAMGLVGWKSLHRLAYVAAALVLHHLLLAPFAPRGLTLVVFGLTAVVAPLRWLRARRVPPR
ncbi:MAG: ferric reductase-like transmembrane domain-containing protein [Acidobacteriota bacterium]